MVDPTPVSFPWNRDVLGRMVRATWILWAMEQPNPKPSWLVPYDELSEPDKEVDRRIGEQMASVGAETLFAELAAERAAHAQTREHLERVVAAARAIEWVEDTEYAGLYCPACGNEQQQGHAPDCALGAALAIVSPPPTAPTTTEE